MAQDREGGSRGTIAGIQLISDFAAASVPHPPSTPVNSSPADDATGVSRTPTLQASGFSDPDAEDTHVASQWIVSYAAPPISNVVGPPKFDSGIDTVNKTSCPIPESAGLAHGATYRWQVRYQDSTGAWSSYSEPTEFTTVPPPNIAPNTPANSSPAAGVTGVNVPPTLEASAFYDVNGNDTHAASQWVVRRVSDSSVVFDSGTDTVNKTKRTIPGLEHSTAYTWHVRYQDSRGEWSWFSSPTSFITAADPSGSQWSRGNLPSGVTEDLNGSVYGGGLYVVVGANGGVFTSADGITWTQRTSGTTLPLYGVAYGSGTFVAVGDMGVILTSPDGITWTLRNSGDSNSLSDVTYANGRFVAVGANGVVVTSTDGITWSTHVANPDRYLYGITYGNGLYVAVGQAGYIATSPDGITWTARTSGTPNELKSVVFGDGAFVAVGNSLTLLRSSDGIAWTTIHTDPENAQGFYSASFGGGLFVVTGYFGTVWTSANGTYWADRSLETPQPLWSVAYGDAGFVVVGGSGDAWRYNSGVVPVVSEMKGTYTGLIEGSTFSNEISGFFTFVLSANGRFTVTIYLGGIRFTTRGMLSDTGTFAGTAKGGGRSLQVSFVLQPDISGGFTLSGLISDGATQVSLNGSRSSYSLLNPTTHAGKYTMVLMPPDEPGAIAQANGYGTAKISAIGKIRFTGVLGDGTKVSQGAQLSNDQWPCFLRPYKGRGLVLGKLLFRDEPQISDFDGTLKWFRPGRAKGAFFPVGADGQAQSTIEAIGSRYVSIKGQRALAFADTAENGFVQILGGRPGENFELLEMLTLSVKNKITVSGSSSLKMKLAAGSGIFSGSFKDGSAKRTFKGVVFQKQNIATGLFKGAGEPGFVWMVDARVE